MTHTWASAWRPSTFVMGQMSIWGQFWVTSAGTPSVTVANSSCSFFFFLATRLFHILSYIWFRPNLVKVTSTLTTTQAQTMMGSQVTMGHCGQKGHFHQKGIKSCRILSINAWLMHMHKLDPIYKSYVLKNHTGSFEVTGSKGHFHQKGIKSFRIRSIDA